MSDKPATFDATTVTDEAGAAAGALSTLIGAIGWREAMAAQKSVPSGAIRM